MSAVRTVRAVRAVAVVGLALVTLAAARGAAASDPGDIITRYDMTIDLGPDGTAAVQLDLDVNFGNTPNHGPYLTFLSTQRYDDTQDRVYRFQDVRASSPDAPSDVDVQQEGAAIAVRVGDPETEITGVHSYTVTFTVEGWVNSASVFDNPGDELYLNVITDWDIPVQGVTVTVAGPADVRRVDCFAEGVGCTSSSDGAGAVFTQDRVEPYADLTVAVGYPAGTFGGVKPILQERWSAGRAFAVTPASGGLAGLVALGGAGLVIGRVRRRGRDEQYLGLTPGLQPVGTMGQTVGVRQRGPVAVQFAPPEGFHPGQLGTLVDERADPHDVTATIVDLAVRGYLRIVRLGEPGRGPADDWRLDRSNRPDADLLPYERLLLGEVFADGPSVVLSDLRTTFATSLARVRDHLYADVTARGWFRGNPKDVRGRWIAGGVLLMIAGAALMAVLAVATSFGLVGVGLVLVGVVVLAVARSAPARTADGTGVLAQALGFRQYLATAEANQIRFEEGEDLFSRYLPYAVAFGLTERWATVFAELAAQGRVLPEPSWYVGPGYGAWPFWAMAGTFGQDFSQFTHVADTALAAPTPGASGESGFSGGFSGGGVGGGGGGTW